MQIEGWRKGVHAALIAVTIPVMMACQCADERSIDFINQFGGSGLFEQFCGSGGTEGLASIEAASCPLPQDSKPIAAHASS